MDIVQIKHYKLIITVGWNFGRKFDICVLIDCSIVKYKVITHVFKIVIYIIDKTIITE